MNRRYSIIFLVILLVLFIIFGLYIYKHNKIISDDIDKKIVTNKVREKFVSSLKEFYRKSKPFNECMKNNLGDKYCYVEAVKSRVIETKDVLYCKDLLNEETIKECEDYFYRNKAEESDDEKICGKLEDKNECLETILTKKAMKENDEKICDKLSEESKRSCLIQVIQKKALDTKNPELCDKLVYKRKDGDKEIEERFDVDMCKSDIENGIKMNEDESGIDINNPEVLENK